MLFHRYLKFFLDMGIRMVRWPEPNPTGAPSWWGGRRGTRNGVFPLPPFTAWAGSRWGGCFCPLGFPPRLAQPKGGRRKTAMKTRAAVALEKGKPLTVTE